MTEEIYIKLKDYENLFYTATQRNYVMFGTLERKRELSVLYTEIFNKKSKMLNGCGTCALREVKEIANEYYKVQKEQEPKEDKPIEKEVVKPKRVYKKTQKSKEE